MKAVPDSCAAAIPLLFLLASGCAPDGPQLDKAGQLLVELKQAVADGNTDQAIALLNASLDQRPDPWAYFERAPLHAAAARDEQAQQDREAGLALDQGNRDLQWLQAELNKSPGKRFRGRRAQPPRVDK